MEQNEKTNKLKIIRISDINKKIRSDAAGYINECESRYEYMLYCAAQGMAQNIADKPIILLSGPSGSGKTTSAYKIGGYLKEMGIEPLIISMDDYFSTEIPTARLRDGQIDYESPERLDSKLLSEHLDILASGGSVRLPIYDFKNNERLWGNTVSRAKNGVVIIEGIHALNPDVTGGNHSYSSFVYVSVRTRMADDSGTLLHPSKIRLMRRLSRDKLYRNRSYLETAKKFGSVQRGERLYIEPYKHLADHNIDTFIPYEACIYKSVIPDILDDCDEKGYSKEYGELPHFIKLIEQTGRELLPEGSLIREFVG